MNHAHIRLQKLLHTYVHIEKLTYLRIRKTMINEFFYVHSVFVHRETAKYAYMEMFAVVALLLATTIKRTHTCTRQSKYPLAVLFCSERAVREMTF